MNKQEKADLCVVRPLSDTSFEIDSSSGMTYFVTTFTQHSAARCSCPWGEIHGEASCQNGCSHMMAVWAYVTAEQEQDYYQRTDAAGETYWSARQAGYSEEDAADAADSMMGYFDDE